MGSRFSKAEILFDVMKATAERWKKAKSERVFCFAHLLHSSSCVSLSFGCVLVCEVERVCECVRLTLLAQFSRGFRNSCDRLVFPRVDPPPSQYQSPTFCFTQKGRKSGIGYERESPASSVKRDVQQKSLSPLIYCTSFNECFWMHVFIQDEAQSESPGVVGPSES
jgi:hypothetical protein